jgi:hypothetical protein
MAGCLVAAATPSPLEISAGFRQTQLVAKGVKHVEVVFAFYVLIKAHQGNHHQRNAQAAQFTGQKPVREAAKYKGVENRCLGGREEQNQGFDAEKKNQGNETAHPMDEIITVLFQNILQNVADGGGMQQIPEEPPSPVSDPQGVTENQPGCEKIDPRHTQFFMPLTTLPVAAFFILYNNTG